MRIQHNIMAMNAYRNYNNNTSALSKNLEKLSSGYKINRAGDDAAGLAISEKMRAQISGLSAASKNVKDGISLVKTAEGAMQEVQDMLNRMSYLATQSANGTYDNEVDRLNLQKEVTALSKEIDRIADSANFNGIKLMDGSLASVGKSSAVTSVTTDAYTAAGVNDTFAASYVTNRPAAATTATKAEFTVSLDDLALTKADTGEKHNVSITVGDATWKFTSADDSAMTAAQIATMIATSGGTYATGTYTASTGVTNAVNNYAQIDGNVYEMTATDNTIKFTMVEDPKNGAVVNPDYKVSVTMTAGDGGSASGTVNDHVQVTKQGVGVGASHQAQVDVSVDFSKLKDGDELTVGGKSYLFKVGENGSAVAGTTGKTLIDLSAILKTDADLADAAKQAEAMVAITKEMDGNDQWTVGNGGVSGNVGTLTFQSKSAYNDNTTNIFGTSTKAKMDTEANIMAQFVSKGSGNDAKVSVEFDVTKIKAGDVLTIDGTTFEFTDGTRTSDAAYTAIDLSAYNIKDGIAAYNSDKVMTAIKTAVDGVFSSKYTVAVDGNKLSLTSKDDAATTAVFENRKAASVSFGGGSGLTLQIGDTADDYNKLQVSVGDMHVAALGIGDIDIGNQEGAAAAVDKIKAAINSVSSTRGDLGAIQNRLEHTQNNLSVMAENITDAESTIRDTDVADEMMAYTKNNILIQSAQAMLAQANAVPQGVLQLLQ